ncbi:MAG: hypothetical protein JNK84_19450 [Phreatobacter sp.]|uniref:hypothetical protein n=1 Tax=Phreatobacter sp. TaxID=1966341 RepID=UPI001A598418|nr:hypothetical protein [Phreatobacter sp.]MBL8571256.1 hypothetical protein [Phreatobacter sp.]
MVTEVQMAMAWLSEMRTSRISEIVPLQPQRTVADIIEHLANEPSVSSLFSQLNEKSRQEAIAQLKSATPPGLKASLPYAVPPDIRNNRRDNVSGLWGEVGDQWVEAMCGAGYEKQVK